jgi:hypothetical protein
MSNEAGEPNVISIEIRLVKYPPGKDNKAGGLPGASDGAE